MHPGTMTDMDTPVRHICDGPKVSMTDTCVNNVVVNDTPMLHFVQGLYRVLKCDVIKFSFLHFSIHFHDFISVGNDEKTSHTKFDMNWLMVA